MPDKEDTSADFDTQGATSRPGGLAEGGITPQPGDAVSPAQAGPGDAKAREEMRRRGFGDDKGGDIS
jgi:hypothetical protein